MSNPLPPSEMPAGRPRSPRFATTRWSLVLRAGQAEAGTAARDALARLCETYWYPLYAHVRRRGLSPHDAEDVTQTFFAHLLRRELIARADPQRGRFRSFLLTALDWFLRDEWQKRHAQKRGGFTKLVPLDLPAAERRLELEPAELSTPDREFDRRWAMTLLEVVLTRLERDYGERGQRELFITLRPALLGSSSEQPYAALANQLAMSEAAVKVAVHRLRQRYRERLRDEIAETVATPAEADAELRHLFHAIA